jgi:hypothetical protein
MNAATCLMVQVLLDTAHLANERVDPFEEEIPS